MNNSCKKNGGPWWGVPKDLDNKKFSVLGPLENDTQMGNKVIKKQDEGKNFICETIETSAMTRKQVIEYWEKEGYELIDSTDLFKA